jgi:hypothetical protein
VWRPRGRLEGRVPPPFPRPKAPPDQFVGQSLGHYLLLLIHEVDGQTIRPSPSVANLTSIWPVVCCASSCFDVPDFSCFFAESDDAKTTREPLKVFCSAKDLCHLLPISKINRCLWKRTSHTCLPTELKMSTMKFMFRWKFHSQF